MDMELRQIWKLQREKRESWLKEDSDDEDELLQASSQAIPWRVEIEWVPEQQPEKERIEGESQTATLRRIIGCPSKTILYPKKRWMQKEGEIRTFFFNTRYLHLVELNL